MTLEVEFGAELLQTRRAFEPFNSKVIIKVLRQVAALGERTRAAFNGTLERPLPCVDAEMVEEVASFFELFATAFVATNE